MICVYNCNYFITLVCYAFVKIFNIFNTDLTNYFKGEFEYKFENGEAKFEEKTKPVAGSKDLSTYVKLVNLLDKQTVKEFMGVNTYEDVVYYSKENFEEFFVQELSE